jgi:tripartite-type tricarboxylate transporter receptor subunit TctC
MIARLLAVSPVAIRLIVGGDRMRCILSLIVMALCPTLLHAAEQFPTRPVRIVVPFPAGGPSDILARMMAPKLTAVWGQQIIIDNRPGGGTIIGTDLVAKAPPDGHTVVMIYTGHATNPSLHSNLPYDTLRDFSAVTLCTTLPIVLAMHPAIPANTLKELIALAKAKPGTLAFATSGNGSTGHLAGEMFKSVAGVNLVHIPYKGSAPAISDVLGGQVAMTFDGLPAALPHVKAGKLKALAVTSTARSPLLPDVPTVAEHGYPGFAADAWFGVIAPSKTPKDVIAKLSTDMINAVRARDVSDKLVEMGYRPIANTPEEFDQFIRAEITKWSGVIKQAGIQID